MTSFSSLRFRLVGTVFFAVAPAWVMMYFADKYYAAHYGAHLPWSGFAVGLLALGAAWFGGERFILRQVRVLNRAAQLLRTGDLSSRTGLAHERGELGDLARNIDGMAAALEDRAKERERTERMLLCRSFQQTTVAALGQFAMMSNDIAALLNQAVLLVAQTLEVEFCYLLELQPGGKFLLLRAGVGWKPGQVGKAVIPADPQTEAGFTLSAGEAVVFERLATETRFRSSPLVTDHGVASGITVAIGGHGQAFGVLGALTARQRRFTEEEVHFLFSLSTLLAMAVARIRAQTELQKLAAFAKLNPNPAMEITRDGAVTYFNDAARRLGQSVGQDNPRELLPPDAREIVQECLAAGRSVLDRQTVFAGRTLCWSFHPVAAGQVVHCYVEDITNRLSLEAQLRQSQKMESIGQLAAGVAHDFNNMLTVIQGHAGMMMARPNLSSELSDSAGAIYSAAERAATLTRQLLMFSRKNVMKAEAQDLRAIVGELTSMLRRLLGETITLEFKPPPELPLVQADRGMVEQVIMNLAVNARDAMPGGGTLTISIEPVELNDAYVHTHPEARLGAFVCLRVSDTGCGMDAATMSRIFEPFFTTKEGGKGTGLGLAMVYGIVKQHDGWIEVGSEVGKGTTFDVLFPASTEPAKTLAPAAVQGAVRGGRETILVVEDEALLRDMAHLILQDCGYRVLEAVSGAEALQVWERNSGGIDLVITDVVMPGGMSGRELAVKLKTSKPQLKIILTSGYNMEESNTTFFRRSGARFLQKPYTRPDLAKVVRECLDNQDGAG
ncbi:MAG TPA: ATP-binding protein [Candidatus Paceibacterota bacterium]|nr:ATP-binding protein [Verrucomicrobiota bacterium]HSA12699.1 ATP-binding protein [Candidatus Paceibacterota bacterium]